MASKMSVTFLDVGQGDGTVITGTSGEITLIDLGSKKNAEIAGADAVGAVVSIILASQKKRKLDNPQLDRLVITHGDGDHYNLLVTLVVFVKRATGLALQINEVVIGGSEKEYTDKLLWEYILTPAKNNKDLVVFDNAIHDRMDEDGKVMPRWLVENKTGSLYLLSVNYPARESGGKNGKSVVLMLEYAKRKVIFCGDAEGPTEDAILGYYAKNPKFLESFALKLGHHGSVAGSSIAWLKAVKQQASFASADMKYAHPYCETITRIKNTLGEGLQLYDHSWICGRGRGETKEYTSSYDKRGFYANMASISGSKFYDSEEKKWYAPGLVQGVQYQLDIHEDGSMLLIDTLNGSSGIINPTDAIAPEFLEDSSVHPQDLNHRQTTDNAAALPRSCCA